MPIITHICLSDMHFGEEDSLLTALKEASTDIDPMAQSPVLIQLVKCLEDLVARFCPEKPTLVLAGDILELALCDAHESYMAFERFLELTMPKGRELFGEIVFIPGNHDHHLWEIARERQYERYIQRHERDKLDEKRLFKPWHTSELFPRKHRHVSIPVLDRLMCRLIAPEDKGTTFDAQRELKHPVMASYPNFGLYQRQHDRCVVFHHGHFTEPLYSLMSKLRDFLFPEEKKDLMVWDLEAENFAWIDFFWSSLGRSGSVGHDIEVIYECLLSEKGQQWLIDKCAAALDRKLKVPLLLEPIDRPLFRALLQAAVDQVGALEKKQVVKACSDALEQGIRDYLKGPLAEQIKGERKHNMPSDVTFVFGHSHKPFEQDMDCPGYPRWVNVYNTGGWVVESVEDQPIHGASIVVVDEERNTAALRMYNEPEGATRQPVRVMQSTHEGETDNPLTRDLRTGIDPHAAPWCDFSDVTYGELATRKAKLRERIGLLDQRAAELE